MLDGLLPHGQILKCGPRSGRIKTDLPSIRKWWGWGRLELPTYGLGI